MCDPRPAVARLAELGTLHLIREPIEAALVAYVARLDPGDPSPRRHRSAADFAAARRRDPAPMTAAEIARALGPAHRSGRWWRCRCPVHGSRGSTLALRDGDRALVALCHAGCSRADILAELRRRGLLDGIEDRPPSTPAARDDHARRIEIARRIWGMARDARATPVARYLAGRYRCRRPCATRPRCGTRTAPRGRRWCRASTGRTAS
jgi:hypothetical protein